MEQELIQQLSRDGITKLTTATRIGSYSVTERSSLATQQVHNRSNGDWKKAQYVIVKVNPNDQTPFVTCLTGWKRLAEPGQFLIIYENGGWQYFDSAGNAVQYNAMVTPRRSNNINSRQLILFGAPGTGKSRTAEEIFNTANIASNGRAILYRTTFHPDYEYADFVGSYKPVTEKKNVYGLDSNGQSHLLVDVNNNPIEESFVIYKFNIQVFLNAYLSAWKTSDPVFLIIEEINRGNCAQIFGDVFQLLDRSSLGYSKYATTPNSEITKYFKEELQNTQWRSDLKDICNDRGETIATAADIKDGSKLVLPPNFNIIATMNTSDQSLYPMDSAFKRRFDWMYVPISFVDENKQSKTADEFEMQVEMSDKKTYDIVYKDNSAYETWCANNNVGFDKNVELGKSAWRLFVEHANNRIKKCLSSEDKLIGEYFINADSNNRIITSQQFISKITFYLWSEIYKDEIDNIDSIFNFTELGKETVYYSFQDFFDDSKKDKAIIDLLDNLGLTLPLKQPLNTQAANRTLNSEEIPPEFREERERENDNPRT